MKTSSIGWQAAVLTALAVGSIVTLGWSILSGWGSDAPFMPHSHCFLLNRELILLHGISDLLIGTSYVAISALLTFLVVKARREIPFHWMMLAFATFIIACGATHFMEVWTLEAARPPYWLSGQVKLVTALASVATALLLPPLIPRVLKLLEEAQLSAARKQHLEEAHEELRGLYSRVTELDELKTTFFANASHELRTPLTLILGRVQRMMEKPEVSSEDREELKAMERSALLLHKHVTDLLDISRFDAGRLPVQMEPVDLAKLVRLVASYFVSSAPPLRYSIETPESLSAVADADKLHRVVFNLIGNAVKFTPPEGLIRVTLRQEKDAAVIAVEDSGPGIPEHLREVVFDRYRQGEHTTERSGQGVGLGLAIAREFVELHHGSIQVLTSPEGGASFVVRIPLNPAPGASPAEGTKSTAIEQSPEQTAMRRKTASAFQPPPEVQDWEFSSAVAVEGERTILVVDDNSEMRDLISRTLSPEYRIRLAADAEEGMRIARKETPDLILTDLMMPRMDGEEWIRLLRSEAGPLQIVPIILLTAKADDEVKLRLLKGGAQDYLVKPFALEELRARVRNHLTTKVARDTLQSELASTEVDVARLASDLATRARQLGEARVAAEAAGAAKDKFMAMLSHELRTPLTPALAVTLELEEKAVGGAEETRTALGVIRRNIEAEARLVDDLLNFTRVQRGQLVLDRVRLDLHGLLAEAVQHTAPAAATAGVSIRKELEASASWIDGDRPRLMHVFENLLGNAIKFTPSGGEIVLETRNEDGAILVRVADPGSGITQEVLGKIFEPFEQGASLDGHRVAGLGLGLPIAKGFIRAHGGTISAQSEGEGKGSAFTVSLPHAQKAPSENSSELPPPTSKPLPASNARPLRERVLLVEDHEDTRNAMRRLLQRWGYNVETASTVAEALGKVRFARFDLLVSDLGLPDGHGTDVMREFKSAGGDVIGIAVSGYGMEEDIRRSLSAGFSMHLIKPVAAQRLKKALEEISFGSPL